MQQQIKMPLFPDYRQITLVKTRKDYYQRTYVLFEIIKQLKHRYLSVRKQSKKDPSKYILSRYYHGYSLDTLKDSLIRNNVLEDTSAKLYFDLATWIDESGNTPIFSFNKKKRLEQKKWFSGNPLKKDGAYLNLIKSYDFAIDIDNKNLNVAWKDTKKIKEVFDMYKLPYSLSFSGSKGFHIIIDSKWVEIKNKITNRAELFGKVVQNLAKDEFGKGKNGDIKGSIDFSIYDLRRIIRCMYSLNFKDGKEYVVLPLSDEEFDRWKLEDMELENVMKNIKIANRGILERTNGLNENQLKQNVFKFIKDYK